MAKPEKVIVWSKFSLEEIRAYYYNRDLSGLIFEAQKYSDITKESSEALIAILNDIKAKELDVFDFLKEEFADHLENGVVKDNISMSDDELKEFKQEVGKAKVEIKQITKQINDYVRKEKDENGAIKKLDRDDLIDRAIIINSSINVIKRYKLYWDNKYHKKIIDTKKELRCTRKEAEDIAQFSVEYQNYEQAKFDLEEYEELILLIKKKVSNEF